MPQYPAITMFHVQKDAMNAAVAAFERDWPEARINSILEDGLFDWIRDTGGVVPEMHDAFERLTDYAVGRGADGILYSCSAFQTKRCDDRIRPRSGRQDRDLSNGRAHHLVDICRDRRNGATPKPHGNTGPPHDRKCLRCYGLG